ncbi:MAG: electron transfer flavoprotein subunit alpha [Elusimicrobia bacterium]|jgi:electron transfer flavoprotein alpha subunit|nr:electron transfer flavoprotein subunit alpha [Elusimicrobiota bacterium]MBR4633369.1 electron transfer flavoprotein subunit alpha [Elusimicrobiota bacterium]
MANKLNIDLDKCVGCGACEAACPFGAISLKDGKATVDPEKCRFCGSCVQACPVNAIAMQKEEVQDAVDKSLYKGVWVYAEQRHGEISSVVYELLNKGSELAKTLNVPLSAILIGSNISAKAQDLINRGADKVYVYDDPILAEFQDDPYSCILADLIKEEKPEIVLMGATNIGRSFASRVAAKIYTGLTADCTALEVDLETRNLMQTRPAFGGNIMATILTPRHRPQMATVRHKVFKEAKVQEGRTGEIINKTIDAQKIINRTKFIGFFKDQTADINISDADIIVSGGRGLGNPEGFKLIKELADLLGGAVGASRAAVDSDWIAYSHQVGQTGRTVAPKIYIACGISGQIQHMVGMSSSDTIIAINKDKDCPMMQVATYSLVGDLYEIIPAIIKEIKQIKG